MFPSCRSIRHNAAMAARSADIRGGRAGRGKSSASAARRICVGQPLLFEIGWEVCWQLGGIYTVLQSKVPAMLERWGDRYCLIGPYNPQTAAIEFEEQASDGVIRQTLDHLRNQGIGCHFGRWLVPGGPRVILLDYRGRFASLDADKYLLWKDHGISTVANDGEVNEVIAFGFTLAEFFIALVRELDGSTPVIAHFHEWMAGVAVPRIAHLKLPISTVFTTHATLLGRYLASDSPEFYNHLPLHQCRRAGGQVRHLSAFRDRAGRCPRSDRFHHRQPGHRL